MPELVDRKTFQQLRESYEQEGLIVGIGLALKEFW